MRCDFLKYNYEIDGIIPRDTCNGQWGMCATESVSKVLTLIQSTKQATEPPPLDKGNHESIWITTKKVISYKHEVQAEDPSYMTLLSAPIKGRS